MHVSMDINEMKQTRQSSPLYIGRFIYVSDI